MLTLSTTPYTFQVDEAAYTLPLFTAEHFGIMDERVYSLPSEKQPGALASMIIDIAVDKRTKDVLKKIGLTDLGKLFREWSGIGQVVEPGESPISTD